MTKLQDAELLRMIINHLPTSIFVKDDQLNFVLANSACAELMGRSEEELVGHSDRDFFAAEMAAGFVANDQRVIDTGEVQTFEEKVAPKDAHERAMLTRKVRMVGSDGKTYLVGTNTDLSQIKRREEAYKQLAESIPVGIFRVRKDNSVAFSNTMALMYFDMEEAPQSGTFLTQRFADISPGFPGVATRFEYDGGHDRRFLVISSGWLARSGYAQDSAIISIVDVTAMEELKKINDEVSRLNRELAENMQRLKDAQDQLVKKGRLEQLGQLTATVAHELRNPMSSVRTSAYILERKLGEHFEPVSKQVERINKGIVRCDGIITQLLDFSRTRRADVKPEQFDEWLVKVLQDEAKALPSHIALNCSMGTGDAVVHFDKGRLQRAVINLINNAAEALVGTTESPLPNPTAVPVISISTRLEGTRVVLSISDNGPGIPADILEKIREPLFTTKNFGTGLGIPAVEQICVQHGGELQISSTPGEGAMFRIILPIEPVAEAA